MHIGIIGSPDAIETKWLQEEAKKRGHKVTKFSVSDLTFSINSEKFVINPDYNLQDIDIFLVRGIYKTYKAYEQVLDKSTEAFVLIRYLHKFLHKKIVDERLATMPPMTSKLDTAIHLIHHNLSVPKTYQFQRKSIVLKNIDALTFPIIVKDPAGRKGMNIFKFDTKTKLTEFLEQQPELLPYLFQQYLPNDGDIRVLVIGYKALGAMKRFIVPGDFRANISQGAKAATVQLTPEIARISETAAKATQTELAGVDLIESEGKYYVIEVNRAPQFRGFRTYTKVDPSPAIIDYLEEKACS